MPAAGQEAVKADQAGHASSSGQEDEPELYKADDFRMYCMKVLPCSKRFCHDWTVCPYSHPGEKAKRRDPRLFSYTGIACPDMKKDQACVRGDACPYAHNVFEYWLHPTRYRSQLCNDGDKCARKICFFAHSLDELRVPANKPFVPPEALQAATTTATLEAARKSAAAEGAHGASAKAGENMLAALLKAQGGGDNTLLKQLQALTAGQHPIQDQQQLVELLTALMESCGLGAGQGLPFEASKAHSMPGPPRGDDRLDIGASGKSRSDPAARGGRARGRSSSRGRHSIDLGRDLKRGVAQMTIDENSALPSLQSIVEALAASAAQQQQQAAAGGGAFTTHSELAAFSAGMAAAQAAAAAQQQPPPFEDARLHAHQHQQQQQFALQQAQVAAEYADFHAGSQNWHGVSPELLQALAAEAAPEAGPGGGNAAWAPRWRQTRGAMPPPGAHGAGYPITTQAAAHMRARAALTGEPWMGESLAAGSGRGLGPSSFAAPAHLPPLAHPFAGGAPFPAYHHLPEPIPEEAAAHPPLPPAQHLFGAVAKEPSWSEEPVGAHHSFLGPEAEGLDMSLASPKFARGSPYDARRASTESSRRSSDSYMGSLMGQGDLYQPLCAPIDEYTAMRTSMESMRFSMDSMRSAGSPPGTPRGGGGPQGAGGFTDYRGSSLFAYSTPYAAPAVPSPAAFTPKSPADGAPLQGVHHADSLRSSQNSLVDQQQ